MYTIIVISLVYILYKCLVLTGTDGRHVPVVNAPAECWPDPLVQLDWTGRPQVILCAILSYPLPPLWWAGTHSWRERRIHHLCAECTTHRSSQEVHKHAHTSTAVAGHWDEVPALQ